MTIREEEKKKKKKKKKRKREEKINHKILNKEFQVYYLRENLKLHGIYDEILCENIFLLP